VGRSYSPSSRRSSPSTGTHTGTWYSTPTHQSQREAHLQHILIQVLGTVHLITKVTEKLTFNRNSYRHLVQYTYSPKSKRSSPSTYTHIGTWYSTPHYQSHREAHLQQELIQVLGTVHLLTKVKEKLNFNIYSYRYLVQYTSLPKSQRSSSQQELMKVLETLHLITKVKEKLTFNRNSYRYLV
jgi:hypothetical protein